MSNHPAPLHTTMSDHHPLLFQCPQVRCMKLVQHPNVVRLYEVIDTQTKLYLILELGDGGDLYDYIMRHDSGLSEEVYISRSFQHIPLNDPVLPEKMKSFCRHWLRAEVFLSPPFFFPSFCYLVILGQYFLIFFYLLATQLKP